MTIAMKESVSADPTAYGTVKYVKKADLKVTNIINDNNYHYITVKNVGSKTAGKNTLGVYIDKKLIKKVNVKSIKAGKTLKVKLVTHKKYRAKMHGDKVKIFKVDIKNAVKEINEKNNFFKVK